LNTLNNFVQVQLNKRKIKDTKSILQDALIKIGNLEKLHNNTVDNKSEFGNRITALHDKIDGGEYKYGLYTPRFNELEKKLDGIPYTSCLTLVGGRPSSGKTCKLTSLALDLVESNDDAAVFYMSIDDTTELMVLKMLAVRSGLSTSKIKRYTELKQDEKEKVVEAFAWLEKLQDRFVLADAVAGNSIEALEAHVDWFVKNYPNSKRVFILDNFHKLSTSGLKATKTEAASAMSERIKTITQINNLHMIATIELRKLEGSTAMPHVGDLKDSVQMEYDADVILLVHNDYQVNDKTNIIWRCDDDIDGEVGRIMPVLEVKLCKNKITGMIGSSAYRLNSHNLQITETPYSAIRRLRDAKNSNGRKNNMTF